jgi:hypothetical protein
VSGAREIACSAKAVAICAAVDEIKKRNVQPDIGGSAVCLIETRMKSEECM